MINPEDYCQQCWHRYGIVDEKCKNCGFDPINDEEDAEAYEKAILEYKEYQNGSND